MEVGHQIIAGKGAGGGRLDSAVFRAVKFIISGRLGFSQYLQMASHRQRGGFKLHDFLQKHELECSSVTLNFALFFFCPLHRL